MEGKHPATTKLPTQVVVTRLTNLLASSKARKLSSQEVVGRPVAVLFAMEDVDILMTYLPEEENAQKRKRKVEKVGRKFYLYPYDVQSRENCNKT